MTASTSNRARVGRWLAALLMLAVAIFACGGSGSNGSGLKSVRVLMDWFPNPDHIGLYTAQMNGYYRSQGLNVDLTPPSNATDPLKLISTGSVPLGISYEPDTIIARSNGLHVVAVAAVIPVALNSLIAPNTSPVKSPAMLAGHTVGSAGLPADDLFLDRIYKQYGVDPSSVKKVNVNTDLIAAIVSKQVDAIIGGYRNIEAVQLQDRNLDPMVVPVTTAGVPDYNELVLVANSDKLSADSGYRDMVRRFLVALGKGTADAIADPKVGERAMKGVAKGYSASLISKMVAATAPLLRNSRSFGYMDEQAWQSFADWLQQAGAIKSSVRAADVATGAYLPS